MLLFFLVNEGSRKGDKIPIEEGFTIGRSKGDIQLKDPKTSSLHAKIEKNDNNQLLIIDCNSTNGIKIDGKRVPSIVLQPGLVIQIGKTFLEVCSDQMVQEQELEIERSPEAENRNPMPEQIPETQNFGSELPENNLEDPGEISIEGIPKGESEIFATPDSEEETDPGHQGFSEKPTEEQGAGLVGASEIESEPPLEDFESHDPLVPQEEETDSPHTNDFKVIQTEDRPQKESLIEDPAPVEETEDAPIEVAAKSVDKKKQDPKAVTPPKSEVPDASVIMLNPTVVQQMKNLNTVVRTQRTMKWYDYLTEFCKEIDEKVKNKSKVVVPLDPSVQLTFLQGLQTGTQWVLGYAPREVGLHSVDLPIFQSGAPKKCFSIIPLPDGIGFKTTSPKQVLLNGKSLSSATLKEGDLISIDDTVIEVDFCE